MRAYLFCCVFERRLKISELFYIVCGEGSIHKKILPYRMRTQIRRPDHVVSGCSQYLITLEWFITAFSWARVSAKFSIAEMTRPPRCMFTFCTAASATFNSSKRS